MDANLVPTRDEPAMPSAELDRPLPQPPGPAGPLVFYEYCVSFLFWTLRRPGRLVRLRPGERGVWRGLPYALASLLLGWWGVPWGLVYTPLVLWTDLTGGRVVTEEERAYWAARASPEEGR
jgi:hypothetical protein